MHVVSRRGHVGDGHLLVADRPSRTPQRRPDVSRGDYDASGADSYSGLGISIQPYGTGDTFGWVSNINAEPYVPWSAPDRSGGASNACTAATSWQSQGLSGVCGEVNGVPYVMAPDRLEAIVFPDDGYFYAIIVYGVGGDDQLTAPLQQVIALLSTRGLAE